MSSQGFLFVLFIGLVVAYWIVRGLWRSYVLARMRRVAVAAEPAVEHLDHAIANFNARFPVPAGERLPLAPEDYPPPRPRKPSAPRPRTRRRRTNTYKRQR